MAIGNLSPQSDQDSEPVRSDDQSKFNEFLYINQVSLLLHLQLLHRFFNHCSLLRHNFLVLVHPCVPLQRCVQVNRLSWIRISEAFFGATKNTTVSGEEDDNPLDTGADGLRSQSTHTKRRSSSTENTPDPQNQTR